MSRIVIVGAGVGGLAAAVRLQALGHRVTVFEKSDTVGGKLGVLEHDGFVFDTGPSLVTMPQVLEELFADTGPPLSDSLTLRRLPIAARYRFPDGAQLDMPGDITEIPAALDAALGRGRGAQWSQFLTRAERIWDVTHQPFLESPISMRDMLVGAVLRPADVAALAPWRTLRALGRHCFDDPRLVMLLDRYATYTGSDPRHAPGALAAVPWAEQRWGSWYVEGGLGMIAVALRDRLVALGGTLALGCEVTEISTRADGHVDGVVAADGSRHRADIVVANADAAQVYGRLIRTTPARRAARALRRTTPSLSGFVLLLAVDDPPAGQPHHQILFPSDYDAEFDAVFGRGGAPRPVDDPTVYICAADDPAVVPGAGTAAWFVLVNAPRHDPGGGTDWDTEGLADHYADRILQIMAERGVDVRNRIRHRIVLTPAELSRRTLTPGGSIYGTSSNGPRAAFLRPANASDVPGLYLVGGSSHPGGGLPLVMLSARIVADLIGPS
ncbi:phytoene desaturase family protein [Gordonia rhizosphera]|uniref:Putative phytoene dehydrogenase n=1 Tax=Gordonia rhizosphera NBRC 16068 TaxID=1108045 RepID=K6W2L5_9ACTN|nr:phytoene desaturase family protein [Gordonia rhizosphera]GAB93400.1 putative phytoene dehydrogenase [Gordonia rhizosphera NBRC 16068]